MIRFTEKFKPKTPINTSRSNNQDIIERQDRNVASLQATTIANNSPASVEIAEHEPVEDISLVSTYALDQFVEYAEEVHEVLFVLTMRDVFGDDIPVKAYRKLLKDLKENKFKSPEITILDGGRRAFYSSKFSSIGVRDSFLRKAIEDNGDCAYLFMALIEEFGHYIDHMLRTQYAENTDEDAEGDEGHYYLNRVMYQLISFDIFDESELYYGDVTIGEEEFPLKIDFSEVNRAFSEYNENNDPSEEDFDFGYESFGSGFLNPAADPSEGYGHGTIAKKALEGIFTDMEIMKIYLGNWLRDVSQVLTESSIRHPNNCSCNKCPMYNPLLLNRETTTNIIWVVTARMFIEEIAKDPNKYGISGGFLADFMPGEPLPPPLTINNIVRDFVKGKLQNLALTTVKTVGALILFEKHFKIDDTVPIVRPDILGIYNPEEHIDNPLGLLVAENERTETVTLKKREGGRIIYDERGNIETEQRQVTIFEQVFPDYTRVDPDLDYGGRGKLESEIQDIQEGFGMPKYFRDFGSHAGFDEGTDDNIARSGDGGYTYIRDQLHLAIDLAIDENTADSKYLPLGNALHALEDFYAHSNFVELVLLKENIINNDPSNHPFGEKVDLRPNWTSQTVKGYPLITGSFDKLDTVYSLTEVLIKTIKPDESAIFAPEESWKWDMFDTFVLLILTDISLSQCNTASNNNSNQRECEARREGASEWLAFYIKFIGYRKRFGWVISSLLKENFIQRTLVTAVQRMIFAHVSSVNSIIKHVIKVALCAGQLTMKHYQMFTDAFEEGTLKGRTKEIMERSLSHTRLAKDHKHHPFHEIAAKLAVETTKIVGTLIKKIWDTEDDGLKEHCKISLFSFVHFLFTNPYCTQDYDGDVANSTQQVRDQVASFGPYSMVKRWGEAPGNASTLRDYDGEEDHHHHTEDAARLTREGLDWLLNSDDHLDDIESDLIEKLRAMRDSIFADINENDWGDIRSNKRELYIELQELERALSEEDQPRPETIPNA